MTINADDKLFNSRYYFTEELKESYSPEMKNAFSSIERYYLKPGTITPSVQEGMLFEEERKLRWVAYELIADSCKLLKLPITTIAVACSLFHRFFYRVSFFSYDIIEIAITCIFLATKVEETHRSSREIVSVFYTVYMVF